ncbi:glycosyltransferase [Patescibacteria group bacterium]|nr:glycosyltransferase [Patescibacteria group bacterium]MBU1663239.1 glycosyltransferase [Patescibacteria group bacterium]MBU2007698.1 glycosyltransferase [Patescibacteria group bacterium]MBU2233660.1 glycosyltransferase [Patescibacteria group bacterium]MBU2264339.1 glycosyltransferase [Patescibacteria group bacterium]
MKVALIHDHLVQDGGAEKVLKVLADMFPNAPIYTLLYEKKHADKYFKNRHIETSIIQRLPGGIKHYQWYMPFMPMAVEFFDLNGFDVVISDASAFAKGVITSSHTLHICYCHTPTRYLWSDTHQYICDLKYNKYFKKVISLVLNYIRMWDRLAADRVDKYIANSCFVAKRIKKYYKRESIVIYPPVQINQFKISDKIGDYFLIGGRLAPYKRVDIVIETFKRLGKKLKIFGDGVDLERLKKIAGKDSNIEFLGCVNDETKTDLYSHCIAFINPQEEDFGITVVEAMASGRPVIAFRSGGALEIMQDGVTGIFFNEQTADSLVQALTNFDAAKFDPEIIKQHSEQFSVEIFKKKIKNFVDEEYEEFKI